jgi:hypothetical protein
MRYLGKKSKGVNDQGGKFMAWTVEPRDPFDGKPRLQIRPRNSGGVRNRSVNCQVSDRDASNFKDTGKTGSGTATPTADPTTKR